MKETKSSAPDILKKGMEAMEQRAALRDKPDGERSMAKTVAMFNTYTGKSITEAEGWAFMVFLKMVRAQGGKFHEDDYVDGASFMALLGECESITRETKDTPKSVYKNLEDIIDDINKKYPPSVKPGILPPSPGFYGPIGEVRYASGSKYEQRHMRNREEND